MILDRFGLAEDIPRVHAFARTYLKASSWSGVGRDLLKRTSPVLHIHDLGNGLLSVGDRSIAIGKIRRKAASLLIYLVARPRQSATRERVLDDLWPDLSPDAAANSLNQTLYFLRRDIDPGYEIGTSAEYVRFEGETLALDEDLVMSDSLAFHRAAVQLAAEPTPDLKRLLAAVDGYLGSFAP